MDDNMMNQNYEPVKPKKKLGFLPGFIVGVLFSVIVVVGVGASMVMAFVNGNLPIAGISRNTNPEDVPDNSADLDIDKLNSKMRMLQSIISQYYLFDEDMADVEDGVYSGLMSGLGDPYSVYYTAEEYADLNESTSGTYCGIGAMVSKNATTGVISVVKVFDGTPSKEAGLEVGDILYKVDDTEVTGMDLDIVVSNYIRGEEGTDVHITVMRGENYKEVELTITRRSIEIPTVEYQMLEDHIGYIGVSQFDEVTTDQFEKAIEDLQSQGMEKLIIDLRDNPGGLLDAVVDMLDYVLPDGLLVYTADKNGNGNKYYSDDGHELSMPIDIIVNGNSASASEVFTGAIKDFKWGTIIGTQTFGKGIVQNVIPLGDGTAIKITTQHYYTPSGFDLHGKGIAPDKEVELDENAVYMEDSDNQLKAAIDDIKAK